MPRTCMKLVMSGDVMCNQSSYFYHLKDNSPLLEVVSNSFSVVSWLYFVFRRTKQEASFA